LGGAPPNKKFLLLVDLLVERLTFFLIERFNALVERLAERLVERLVERRVERLVERLAERLVERLAERLAERLVERLATRVERLRELRLVTFLVIIYTYIQYFIFT
jgi:dihydroneopterin aldolase